MSCRMHTGWEYAGELTQGKTRPCLDEPSLDLGAMWECPFFAELQDQSTPSTITHILCVSPYPHHLKDRPTNPCLYWLGDFQGQRFDLEAAHGETAEGLLCFRSDACCLSLACCAVLHRISLLLGEHADCSCNLSALAMF